VSNVLNTIIEKDIFARLDIRDKHNFNKIIDFAFDSVGSFVSPRSISDTLRTHGTIVDKQIVAKYLDALCHAFLLYKAPRYLELLRRYRDVYVGKINNLEVDFVVTDREGYTSYYQVAWTTDNEETLKRELASLNAIKDSNPKYLLTMDLDFNPVYDGIRKLNVADWMLQKSTINE
jgi:predicted AAA+ superfamily ATPase